MAAPVTQKLIVEVVPLGHTPASGQAAERAVRALARIIGCQIAREQFRKQHDTYVASGDQTGEVKIWRTQQAADAEKQ